jgi:hypothetical protein
MEVDESKLQQMERNLTRDQTMYDEEERKDVPKAEVKKGILEEMLDKMKAE